MRQVLRTFASVLMGMTALIRWGDCGATTIDLSWHGCSPIIPHADPPGPAPMSLYVSAIGQAEPHQAYEFWLTLRTVEGGFPDAWRFDAEGCQGPGRVQIEHFVVIPTKTCPNFQGAAASYQIREFKAAPEFLGQPAGTYVAYLANTYPAGATTTNPAARYFLGAVVFDHTLSESGPGTPGVTCGGYEKTICVQFVPSRVNWLDMAGVEVPFRLGQWWATFRDQPSCHGPVPAVAATWGSLKAQYR
jgi:hypothetical protein